MELIKLTHDNIDQEHICCAISSNKDVQVMSKKAWLKERLDEGLVFLKGSVRGKCFIEYIPAESAWTPIEAEGYMYIDCLWVSGQFKGHGYSNLLLDACMEDSKAQGKKGLVILSSKKKLGFLSDPGYMRHKSAGRLKLSSAIKALLESGTDPKIIDIKQRIGRAGFTWALDKPTGASYEITPVRAIINAYHLLGAPAFSRMLGLMAGAWHGTQMSLAGDMISGMALFLKTYEKELDDYEVIRRLAAIDPAVIIQMSRVDTPPLRYARLIRTKYNEWPSGEKLPYRFNK